MAEHSEGWKTIERIISAIKALDTEPTTQSLNDGAAMLQDLTIRD